MLIREEIEWGIGKSSWCSDIWNRLGGQTLVMIGRWYPRQPFTKHE